MRGMSPAVRVDASRCSRTRIVEASCRSCVGACPRNALALGEAGVQVSAERCDGCGLCAAACPTEAIAVAGAAIDPVRRRGASACVACDRSGVRREDSGPPCVHALDWRSLVRLHDQGVREIVAAVGDCDGCARGGAPRIDEAVLRVDLAVRSRGRPGLSLRYADAPTWSHWSDGAARLAARSLDRRVFLRRWVAPRRDEHRSARADRPVFGPSINAAAVHARVPSIDAARCDGCDACVRLCPTGALTQETLDTRSRYRLDASRCDGCRICVDVCDRDAVTVLAWTRHVQLELLLFARTCPSCGVEHHVPAARRGMSCRVCAHRPALASPRLRVAVD